MENFLLTCIESRIENNTTFYGRFQLGPFEGGQGLTIANALRRVLLSELSGLAIVAVDIQGVTHEYSYLKGIRESILDILLNLKQIVLTSDFDCKDTQIAYLNVQGPGKIKAKDIKLPISLQCVDPEQYLATLSHDGSLIMKLLICYGKNYSIQKNESKNLIKKISFFEKNKIEKNLFKNLLPIDSIYMPIKKVNYIVESDDETVQLKDRIILEIWTNGSIHPRQAIHNAAKILVQLFSPFQEAQPLKSLFLNTKNIKVLNYLDTNTSVNIFNKKHTSFIDKKLASLDIGNLDLSLRPYTCLKRASIHTIGDLLKYSKEELLLLKNFGKRSLEEVETNLFQIGFKLKNTNGVDIQLIKK
uniref:DNA-directed RNA polymerase subunit alpha n=1 Tax=Gloeotilopsis sterilis TaxID=160069 RepID=A0A097KNP6_GLOST|nr:alpha subunit of RNA polymerase [Gloeotilopsis sterilis]AIT94792.1 alpha subunit of RNA polymerase [Gloeotilopsis sterilis]